MPKRSWVWNHCMVSEDGYTHCNICDKKFKVSTSTSTLIKHLSNTHALQNLNNDEEPCSIPYNENDNRKQNIDKLLVNLIVTDLQPFSIVEDKGFKALLEYLDPRYNMPTRQTLKTLVKRAYDEKKKRIQKELDEASDVCITTDTWTSINTDSFLTVTCHFFYNNFEMRTYIFQTEKMHSSHTSVALANSLRNTFSEWKIEEKVRAIVTDNAANMLAAVKYFPTVYAIPCFAHTLNLVVKKSLKSVEDIENIRRKCRRIITYFKSSCVANDKLTEMQVALNLPRHKLIMEVETRWNSTYEMFERFVEQKQAIIAALSYCNSSIESLIATEWSCISECLPILQPFFILTTELSSESHVSISKVIISIKQLYICLNSSSHHILSNKLQGMMNKYFNDIELNHTYAIATILDPRFKLLGFQTNKSAEAAKTLILQHLSSFNDILSRSTSSTSESSDNDNTSSPVNNTSLWFSFDDEVCKINSINSINYSPSNELNCYINENYMNRQSNPLQFWTINSNKYPNLAKLTRKILCCPATSVPSERVFSKAGNIISKKRNRLKESTLNMTLLLNK